MKKQLIALLALLGMAAVTLTAAPKIVLKFDDLGTKEGQVNMPKTMDYCIKKQIKASYGVIAKRLDSITGKSILEPYMTAKNSKKEALVEIWHHGWDHICPEFKDQTYEYQKEHFDKTTQYINKVLSITMTTFGAPCNQTDDITDRVIGEDPRFKVVLFRQSKAPGVISLNQRVNLENGVGKVEYEYFVNNYKAALAKYPEVMVLQGHPAAWESGRVEEFKKVIDFLLAEGCEFVLPSDMLKK